MNKLMLRAANALDWISEGYRPSPQPMAALRIAFALYVLVWPRDIFWIGEMSTVAYAPPPGPFSLIDSPPPPGVLAALFWLRALVAIWVLFGWHAKLASAVLSFVLIVCSGLAYSYGKVDHLILYDLAPLMLGVAGWGSAWSVDALRRKSGSTTGFPMLLFGIMIAFALFTAAAIKAATGWLNPGRQATHYFVASDYEYSVTRPGPLAEWILQIDNSLFWKLIDYSTIFVEGWLVIAVLFPGLFRIGLLMASAFHLGVWLTMGISFQLYAFVYIGFFLLPFSRWFPEAGVARRRIRHRRRRVGVASAAV